MPQLDYPPNNSYHQVYEIDIRHKGQNNSNANITVATKKVSHNNKEWAFLGMEKGSGIPECHLFYISMDDCKVCFSTICCDS